MCFLERVHFNIMFVHYALELLVNVVQNLTVYF